MALPKFDARTGDWREFSSPGECSLAFSTIAIIASTLVGVYSAVSQGRAQQQSLNYQAAVNRQRADRERQEAAARETDFRRQQSRREAQRRAAFGASGVESGEGSPLLASEDFASEVELAALRIRAGGEVSALRLEQAASLGEFQGRAASRSGFLRGGALLARGAGKSFKSFKKNQALEGAST